MSLVKSPIEQLELVGCSSMHSQYLILGPTWQGIETCTDGKPEFGWEMEEMLE